DGTRRNARLFRGGRLQLSHARGVLQGGGARWLEQAAGVGLRMKVTMLVIAMTLATIVGADVARAETATADAPFRLELAQANGARGLGVEGYVYNGLPWRITNVRVRVESVDENGTVTASASGWVIGDVKGGGRGYF